jgi:transcriptional regulator with XRE-family HTH domain
MVATAYTSIPIPSLGMGNRLHKTESKASASEPKDVLARNLRAAFKARGYSARSVADAIGVSNKTVSNMLNGEGASQLDKLVAVAKHLRIPLWQLLCPSIEISQGTAEAMHELLESFVHLSEVGQAQVKRTIKGELAMAKTEPNQGPDSA